MSVEMDFCIGDGVVMEFEVGGSYQPEPEPGGGESVFGNISILVMDKSVLGTSAVYGTATLEEG